MLASLVLVVHVLSAPPLLAAADFAPRQVAAEQDDCCPSSPGTEADTQESDDCCPDGCKHCPLSCCGGLPGLVGERLGDLSRSLTSPAPPAWTSTRLSASDPRAIYHPPRA